MPNPILETYKHKKTGIVYDLADKAARAGKSNQNTLAPTETSTTASRAYAVGEYFYLVNTLMRCTQPIAQGGTITENANCVAAIAMDEVEALYEHIGYKGASVSAVDANAAPCLKRDITNAFYNGTLRSEIAAGNFKNVRPGDYIIGSSTGTTYYVACCDWMFNKGDQTSAAYQSQAYGTHHLGLMIYKAQPTTRMWAGYGNADQSWTVSANDKGRCPWNAATSADPTSATAKGENNTNITRSYNGANVSGYMGSFIRERIDSILLPQCFQADFGSANVLKFRNINGNAVVTDKPSGGQGNWNGCTSGWGWYDRYCDLPSEVEVYGSRVFGSAMDIGVQCEQLPLFKNANINEFFPRFDFWTKAVAASSYAAYRTSRGHATSDFASCAYWACPLACIK